MGQAEPAVKLTDEQRDALTNRIMFGGDEVVKAKAGGGSATLSMAYAGAEFADSVMSALDGKKVLSLLSFCLLHAGAESADSCLVGLDGKRYCCV